MEKQISVIENKSVLTTRKSFNMQTMQLLIKRYTTDANGVIQDDSTLPANVQKDYPFHLWGEFDRQSGYKIANLNVNKNGCNYVGTYVWGVNTPFFFANPLQNINAQFKHGDVIFLYVDNFNLPNYYSFVVVSANLAGAASLMMQTNVSQIDGVGQWGVFKFDGIVMTYGNDVQLNQPLYMITTRFDGRPKINLINPLSEKDPLLKQSTYSIVVPIECILNQYAGLSGLLDFNNPYLSLIFKLYI